MSTPAAATEEYAQAVETVGYERTSGNGPMGGHPQLKRVIDAILTGESCNSISKWVSPKVTRFTIAKLADVVRKQRDAARIIEKARQLQAATGEVSENGQLIDRLTRDAVMGSRHIARVDRILDPLERQVHLADSENDRIGLSSVAKAALSAIRMQAELDGSLASTTVNQTVNHLSIMVMPNEPVAQAEQPTLDITAESIE